MILPENTQYIPDHLAMSLLPCDSFVFIYVPWSHARQYPVINLWPCLFFKWMPPAEFGVLDCLFKAASRKLGFSSFNALPNKLA